MDNVLYYMVLRWNVVTVVLSFAGVILSVLQGMIEIVLALINHRRMLHPYLMIHRDAMLPAGRAKLNKKPGTQRDYTHRVPAVASRLLALLYIFIRRVLIREQAPVVLM